jgi:hypothetical protein
MGILPACTTAVLAVFSSSSVSSRRRKGRRQTMPICKCGFDFAKARLDSVEYESYAAIPDDDYVDIIRSEAAILAEQDEPRRLDMIAEGVKRVGGIDVCPACGILYFSRPQRGAQDVEATWFRPLTGPPANGCT